MGLAAIPYIFLTLMLIGVFIFAIALAQEQGKIVRRVVTTILSLVIVSQVYLLAIEITSIWGAELK